MEVRIREQTLPGIGSRCEMDVGGKALVVVVVDADRRRELSIVIADADEPKATVSLSEAQALAVAALLSGVRFSVEPAERQEQEPEQVVVQTVTLEEGSAAVGRSVTEIPELLGPGAAVLAVISDETPELVEQDPRIPCRPGNRLVVAAKATEITGTVARLTSPGVR